MTFLNPIKGQNMSPEQLKALQDDIVPGGVVYVKEIKRGGYLYFIDEKGITRGRFSIPITPWWVWAGIAYLVPWAIFLILAIIEAIK